MVLAWCSRVEQQNVLLAHRGKACFCTSDTRLKAQVCPRYSRLSKWKEVQADAYPPKRAASSPMLGNQKSVTLRREAIMSTLTDFNVGVMHMNNKRRILSLLFSLLLTLGAVPAWAVSYNSVWSASRYDNGGSTFKNMTPSATTFCYLRSVGFRDIDSSTEMATCRVTRGALVWTLEAVLSQNDDADAICSAYCYNN